MNHPVWRGIVKLTLLLLFCLFIAACDTRQTPPHTQAAPDTDAPPSSAPNLRATGTITPDVTTNTPVPSGTPTVFIFPRPMSPTPICSPAPPTRLILHERGRVADDDPRPLRIRDGPGVVFGILAQMQVGDVFLVLDGPTCGDGYAWFRVRFDEVEGWIAEGEDDLYYAEPYLTG